jgi:hypothetical protein
MTKPYIRIGACPNFEEISEKTYWLHFHYEKQVVCCPKRSKPPVKLFGILTKKIAGTTYTTVSTWDLTYAYSYFSSYSGRSDVKLSNNPDDCIHLTEYAGTFLSYLYRIICEWNISRLSSHHKMIHPLVLAGGDVTFDYVE